jgi:5-methylcytosine-specific restriction endonuclease McrA
MAYSKASKRCSKCGETKPLIEGFYRLSNSKDGYDRLCKRCNYAANKKHRSKKSVKEHYARQQAAYRTSSNYRKWLQSPNGIAAIRRKKYKRRLLEEHATEITTNTIVLLDEIFGNSCVYCQSEQDITYDHVIPLSLGGTNDLSNLVKACRSCNSSKHTKLLFTEWQPPNLNQQLFKLWQQTN